MTATQKSKLLGFDPAQMYAQGLRFGEADLEVGGDTNQVIGRSAACLLRVRDGNGDSPFQGLTVVAPPISVWNMTDAEILDLILFGTTDLRDGLAPGAEEAREIGNALTIRRCANLDAASLLAEIVGCENQVILVPKAHLYRDTSVPVATGGRRETVLLAEDLWVPHVEAWASRCIELAKKTDSYVLLEVDETAPVRQALIDRLTAVDDLYPSFMRTVGQVSPAALLAEHAARWVAMAANGRMEEALKEVDELDIDAEYKLQLKVQLLSRGDDPKRIQDTLNAYLATEPKISADLSVRFGRIAQQSGDWKTAKALFRGGIDQVADRASLEGMLLSCGDWADPDLEERIFTRLSALFPSSPELPAYRHKLLLALSNASEEHHARQMALRIPFFGIEGELARSFDPPQLERVRDLVARILDLPGRDRDLLLLLCANFAGYQNSTQEAIGIASKISTTGMLFPSACRFLIQSLRRVFLRDTFPTDEDSEVVDGLRFVRRYVANNPQDPQTREAFASLFTVDASGSLGLPIMVSEVLKLAQQGVVVKVTTEDESEQSSLEDLEEFLKRAWDWMSDVGTLDVSSARLPNEVIGGSPLALLNSLVPLIRKGVHSQDPMDFLQAERISFIAACLAREAPLTVVDIGTLRMVATRRATMGQTQRARDLAEQILQLAGSNPERQRLAWGAFADVYQRSRSPIDALVGLSCALELTQEVEAEVLWWETYTLFRICRDVGLTAFAWELLPALKGLHKRLPEPEQNDIQLVSLELSLRVIDPSDREIATLYQLVIDAQAHYKDIQKRADEVVPAVSLLAQSIALLQQAGGTVTDDAKQLLAEALVSIGPEAAQFIRSIASTQPTIEEAIQLYNRVEVARYADDIPGDLIASELAARRVLSTSQYDLSPRDAAAAIELLSDHALDPIGNARALDPDWPLATCLRILPNEGAVLMLALDTEGSLTTVSIDNADIRVSKYGNLRDPYGKCLANWSDRYPKRYGEIEREEGNNEFFSSMAALNIPLPDTQRVLILGDPHVQEVPFNLMFNGNEFAGHTRAFGYVPSLTWLDEAMRRTRVQSGKRKAWISEPGDDVYNSALGAVIIRTSATLQAHGFVLDHEGQVPDDLAESEIAVIAAHGNVGVAGRYFHRVTDESGLLISPTLLANSVAGTELVILFICSGGRIERHPYTNTSVGLPKQLLGAGCRTVIASPWPLSPIMTGVWLTGFMREWDQGKSALDATFIANQAVEANFGFMPQYSLAMTVYGDPLLSNL